jgi:hypothetical protein
MCVYVRLCVCVRMCVYVHERARVYVRGADACFAVRVGTKFPGIGIIEYVEI